MTPTANQANATIKVNTVSVTSGQASGAISLSVGSNTINVLVTAQDGVTYQTYVITVTRAAGSTVITALAIPGVTAPVTGGTPVTTIGTSSQYTGTITWSGNPVTFRHRQPTRQRSH